MTCIEEKFSHLWLLMLSSSYYAELSQNTAGELLQHPYLSKAFGSPFCRFGWKYRKETSYTLRLISILQVALPAASQASATPLTLNATNGLVKRANHGPVSCGRKLELSPKTTKSEVRH